MANVAQLFKECNQGNKEACDTLLYLFYWGPRIARELKKLFGTVVIVPIPRPWPGPESSPPLDANFLQVGDVIRLAMGDANPQPSFISLAKQLKAATELRSAMERVTKALDAEIKRLKK